MYNYRMIKDMVISIKKNLQILDRDFDMIVGVPRSGMIPAYLIGLFLNKKVCSLDEFLTGNIPTNGERNLSCSENFNKILVVDDSINSGSANRIILERLRNTTSVYKTFVVYATYNSFYKVDYYCEIVDNPRVFEWNYLNHSHSRRWCFDIDGVLCEDPKPEQNDDGDKYRDFILNAKPLHIPNYKIYALVTSRLEKYRKETEIWLKNNNVEYEHLFMLNLPTAEERRRMNTHASFKASIYGELKETTLFIESETKQAKEISRLTGKQCISVENNIMYGNDNYQDEPRNIHSAKDIPVSYRIKAFRYALKMKFKNLIKRLE